MTPEEFEAQAQALADQMMSAPGNVGGVPPEIAFGYAGREGISDPVAVAGRAANSASFGITNQAAAGLAGLIESARSGDFSNFNQHRENALGLIREQQNNLSGNEAVLAEGLGLGGGLISGNTLLRGAQQIPYLGRLFASPARRLASTGPINATVNAVKNTAGMARQGAALGGLIGGIQGTTNPDSTTLEGAGQGALAGGLVSGAINPIVGGASLAARLGNKLLGGADDLLANPETLRALQLLEREGALGGKTAQQIIESGSISDDVRAGLQSVMARAQDPERQALLQLESGTRSPRSKALRRDFSMAPASSDEPRGSEIVKFLQKSKAGSTDDLAQEVSTALEKESGLKDITKKSLEQASKDKGFGMRVSKRLAIEPNDLEPIKKMVEEERKLLAKSGFTGLLAKSVRKTLNQFVRDISPKASKTGTITFRSVNDLVDELEDINTLRAQMLEEFTVSKGVKGAQGDPNKLPEYSKTALSKIQRGLYNLIESKLGQKGLSDLTGVPKATFSKIAKNQAALMTLKKALGNFEDAILMAEQKTTATTSALNAIRDPVGARIPKDKVGLIEKLVNSLAKSQDPAIAARGVVDSARTNAIKNIQDYLFFNQKPLDVAAKSVWRPDSRKLGSLAAILASQRAGE